MRLNDQEAAAPSGAVSPSGPDPTRRHIDRLVGGLVLLSILALLGGLLAYTRLHDRKGAPALDARAEVEKAYFAWWGAREKSFLALDSAPVKPYMTAAGLRQEEKLIADQRGPNHPLRLSAEHNTQTVVYRDATTASVDDVWVNHSVDLDPTTMTPIQPDPEITLHDSTVLKKINGQWLVDDVKRFGGSREVPGQDVSYVAQAGGRPLPDGLKKEIEDSFLRYWKVSDEAYLSLDLNALAQVESGVALDKDRSVMQEDIAKNQAVRYDVHHNYRIAIQMDDTAWVYDTTQDGSAFIDRVTRKPLATPATRIHRTSFRLAKGPDGWKVDFRTGS